MIKRSIPSLFTCLNLLCGLFAIIANDPKYGVGLILLAGLLDVLDGTFARMLNATSQIGKELDSLADIVSFGLAPSILLFNTFNSHNNWILYLVPAIIALAGAIRLARFNVKSGSKHLYFEGLAIPASGLFYCGLVLAKTQDHPIMNIIFPNEVSLLILVMFISFLNISTVKMFSFKLLSFKPEVRIYFIILVMAGILLFIYFPYLILVTIFTLYLIMVLLDQLLIQRMLNRDESAV